jgi:hypothetical protein
VLVPVGAWPGADLELTQEAATWAGLGDGHGHLTAREVQVRARGRGAANRPAEAWLHVPSAVGGMADPMKDPSEALPASEGSDSHPLQVVAERVEVS